jgi:putative transposase
MIDRDHKLSIKRQAKLLDISRGAVYYQPRPIHPYNQRLMNRIDRLHLELPFAGARMLRDLLRPEGHRVGRSKVSRLMRLMGIEALYRKPKTTRRNSEHKVYPYLLRNLPVTRCNQVWAMDITYIPMALGFVYLAAVVDWHSRRVLSWKVSTTMDVHFCIEAVEEAMEKFGKPDIFNTDQGSQFTC